MSELSEEAVAKAMEQLKDVPFTDDVTQSVAIALLGRIIQLEERDDRQRSSGDA